MFSVNEFLLYVYRKYTSPLAEVIDIALRGGMNDVELLDLLTEFRKSMEFLEEKQIRAQLEAKPEYERREILEMIKANIPSLTVNPIDNKINLWKARRSADYIPSNPEEPLF